MRGVAAKAEFRLYPERAFRFSRQMIGPITVVLKTDFAEIRGIPA